MRRDGLAGIFLTDLSLVVLQPYTDDTQLARKAIENAGASNPSTYASNNQRARAVRGRLVEMMQSKDESGRVVEKLSNQYRLGGPVEKMEEARRGRIQYVAGFPLDSIPPGAYELKVAVDDGKDSVSRSAAFSVEK